MEELTREELEKLNKEMISINNKIKELKDAEKYLYDCMKENITINDKPVGKTKLDKINNRINNSIISLNNEILITLKQKIN